MMRRAGSTQRGIAIKPGASRGGRRGGSRAIARAGRDQRRFPQAGEQVAVQQSAQAVAHHRTLVNLGTDHQGASPRAGRGATIMRRQQRHLGADHTQQQVRAVVAPTVAVKMVDGLMAPQPMEIGRAHV